MNYKVNIGYKSYFFYDRDEAIDFAEVAAFHQVSDESISISLEQEHEQEGKNEA